MKMMYKLPNQGLPAKQSKPDGGQWAHFDAQIRFCIISGDLQGQMDLEPINNGGYSEEEDEYVIS